MSFRTEPAESSGGEDRLEHVLKRAPVLPPQPQALTISASLGLEPQEPPHPYVPFQPVYPTPQAVPDVVGSLFGDVTADPTALFGKSKKKDPLLQKSDSSKGGGLMSSLKAKGKSALAKAKEATNKLSLEKAKEALSSAKEKASGALSKAKSGMGALAKKVADATADISHFDYEIHAADSTVVGAVKKKGTEVKPKHQILPFPPGVWAGTKIFDKYQQQQANMYKVTTKTKSKNKGGEKVSKETEKTEKGVHVLCMGFTDVSDFDADSVDNVAALEALLYDKDGAARPDVPTLVNARATLKGSDLACVTGLLVEAVDAEGLHEEDGVIPYKFEAVPEEESIGDEMGEITPDNIDDTFIVTVRGIHVTDDKEVQLGPKIYVPKTRDAMSNIAAFGMAEEGVGMVRAFNKATKLEGIDLRLLWATMHFARGMTDLYNSKITPAATKKNLAPLFGGLDGLTNQNSFSMTYDEMVHYGHIDKDADDNDFMLSDEVF